MTAKIIEDMKFLASLQVPFLNKAGHCNTHWNKAVYCYFYLHLFATNNDKFLVQFTWTSTLFPPRYKYFFNSLYSLTKSDINMQLLIRLNETIGV